MSFTFKNIKLIKKMQQKHGCIGYFEKISNCTGSLLGVFT